MIWSWLVEAIFVGFMAFALLVGIIVYERRVARKNALLKARQKDQDNADAIRDRVRDVPDSLREFDERGFRD
jgi:Flp pilus assembly protein TadB